MSLKRKKMEIFGSESLENLLNSLERGETSQHLSQNECLSCPVTITHIQVYCHQQLEKLEMSLSEPGIVVHICNSNT